MWYFHVVLDSVEEGPRGREEFVRRILEEFGVSCSSMRNAVSRVCRKLPLDLGDTDMVEILAVFEETVPIEWHEDVTIVPRELGMECREVLLRILVERPRGTVPKVVTAQMIGELARVLGARLNTEALTRLRDAIEERLINDMWRSLDLASQEQLADRLMYSVRNEGRLTFAES
jgi:hypothetical protein